MTTAATTTVTAQCSYKTAKGRRCKLDAGHAGYTVLDSTGSVIAARLTEEEAKDWQNRGEPGYTYRDDGEHRMVLRTGEIAKPKTLAELKAADPDGFKGFKLTMHAVPKSEGLGREYRREAEPRDADQIRVDADAKTAYDEWVAKGKPDKFEDSPVQRYIFPPAAWDTVVAMLRRSIQIGGPVAGKRLQYRRKTHTSGNLMIYFTITDPKQNGNTND